MKPDVVDFDSEKPSDEIVTLMALAAGDMDQSLAIWLTTPDSDRLVRHLNTAKAREKRERDARMIEWSVMEIPKSRARRLKIKNGSGRVGIIDLTVFIWDGIKHLLPPDLQREPNQIKCDVDDEVYIDTETTFAPGART